MTGKLALGAAALALAASPLAARAGSRMAAPVEDANGLQGQGTPFFLAGIALIALAVVFLPEDGDEPASP
jgi:hypothetical protein